MHSRPRVPRGAVQVTVLLSIRSVLPLLLHAAADVLQVNRRAGVDHIISSDDRAGHHHPQFLTDLQIRLVRRLVVVDKHKLDLPQLPARMQPPEREVTPPDVHLHDIAQPGQIHQRPGDGRKLGVHLQAHVALAAVPAHGVPEQHGGVPGVPAQLDHCFGLDLVDQVCDDLPLRVADVHHVVFRAAVEVDGLDDLGRGAADLVDVGEVVDEVEELDFTSIVELQVNERCQ